MRELTAIVDAMSRRRILVLGDLMLDEYLYGVTDRVSREAPVPVVRHERSDYRPGGAANAAANAASLGAQVQLLGLTGRDEAGDTLASLLEARGIDASGVIRSERPTVRKTRVLAGAPGVAAQQVLRLDRQPDTATHSDLVASLLESLEAAVATAPDALLISDYGVGTLTAPVVQAVRALRPELPVYVDSRYQIRAFAGMTALTPNEPELRAAIPATLGDDATLFQAAAGLRDELKASALLLTRGRHGAALFQAEAGAPCLIPIHGRDEVIDVTGAGDTVIAAFCLAHRAGADFEAAARIANAAAGISVMRSGAAQVTAAQLCAVL